MRDALAFVGLAILVSLMSPCHAAAQAQEPTKASSPNIYFGAGLAFSCRPDGMVRDSPYLTGGVGGWTPAITAIAGGFVTPVVSIAAEIAATGSASGVEVGRVVGGDGQSRSDTRHRDTLISVVGRWHRWETTNRTDAELEGGLTLAFGSTTRAFTVGRQAGTEASGGRLSLGLIGGGDLVVAMRNAHLQVAVGGRAHWLPHSYNPNEIDAGTGDWLILFGAGVRWVQ